MIPIERRWASPAAAVLAFCLTLVICSPPMQPSAPVAAPTSIVANEIAALAGHAFLALVAVAGLFVGAKLALSRPKLRMQDLESTARAHAAA